MSESPTRRAFLKATAASGAVLAANWATQSAIAADSDAWPKLPPAKIYKVYAGRTGDAYLTRPTAEIEKFEKYFASITK